MTFVPLRAADEIYLSTTGCEVRRIPVQADLATAFFGHLQDLEHSVSDSRTDEYWAIGLRRLQTQRYLLQATPLNVAHPELKLLERHHYTREHFSECKSLYPEHVSDVEDVLEALMDLFLSNIDPISDTISDALAEHAANRVGIVLPTFGFEQQVQHHLRQRLRSRIGDVYALTPRTLAMKRPFDIIFVVGKPKWFSKKGWDWIYTTPRASTLTMIGYESSIRERLPSSRAFSNSVTAMVRPIDDEPPRPSEVTGDDDEYDETAVDWPAIFREAGRQAEGAKTTELVDARLYLLATGCAAFLAASAASQVTTLDVDAPEDRRIVDLAPPDIVPGVIVLLRSEGGGDLIPVNADAILGMDANPLRSMQQEWKSRLQVIVDECGADSVIGQLKRHGSARANRVNLANWCSPRTLRTRDQQDFVAIMHTISLGSEAARYWAAMKQLEGAHKQAGQQIRRQLEELARTADLAPLVEDGRVDFSLPEGGGILTAFRVEEVSPHVAAVPYQSLADPFKVRA